MSQSKATKKLVKAAMPNHTSPLFTTTGRLVEATPKPLLQRAHDTINGARQEDYGDKLQNFSQTAMIWQGLLAHKLQPHATITADDVALLMIGLKMSRLAKTPMHKDSILDIAGYAGCMDILQEERVNNKELLGATVDYAAPL
jgi:hypothetical protein